MKTYIGTRLEQGCEVYVTEDGRQYPLPLRLEIRNHSPTGFEWGFGGSGPAQLALAILADHLGPKQPPAACPYCGSRLEGWKCTLREECGYDGEKDGDKWANLTAHPVHYQEFKAQIVAALPKDGFTLSAVQVQEWIVSMWDKKVMR